MEVKKFSNSKNPTDYIAPKYLERVREIIAKNNPKINAIELARIDIAYCMVFYGVGAEGEIQGESVNILLNFTQFFETRIEYRFQIFTAHSCDFLLPSYARLA